MPTNQKFAGLGVRLTPTDTVWNNTYALVIPDFNDESTETGRVCRAGISIRREHPNLPDNKLIRRLKELVESEVHYVNPSDWPSPVLSRGENFVINLDDSIRRHAGICIEQAALLSIILNRMDFYAEFAWGLTSDRGFARHAWANVVERNGSGEELMIEDLAPDFLSMPYGGTNEIRYFERPMAPRVRKLSELGDNPFNRFALIQNKEHHERLILD